jgi:glycosyltransferase involved in cell wall biosynthesis
MMLNRIARAGYDFLSMPVMARISDGLLTRRFTRLSQAATRRAEPASAWPKITVVVPVYNVERYLELCLLSLSAQQYPNLEVIAVDDGSTDGSAAILKANATKLNLKVVTQKNAGLAAARNAGVKAIDASDYLMFLDSDDALAPGALHKMVKLIQETKSDFVVGDVTRLKGLTRIKRVDTRALYKPGTQRATTFAKQPNAVLDVTAWNKLFNFDFYHRTKIEFPSMYFEDMSEMTRAYAEAKHFDVLAETIYLWRVRTEGARSITQQTSDAQKFADRLKSLRQIQKTIQKAIKDGRATEQNAVVFARRIREHDLKLYANSVPNAAELLNEFL